MRDEPNALLKCQKKIQRHHKGCIFILTAGQWSWKSKSAKECEKKISDLFSIEIGIFIYAFTIGNEEKNILYHEKIIFL